MEMSRPRIDPRYYGVSEAETLTGISKWTWRKWAYDGKIGSVKFGSRLLIPVEEIDRLVSENTRARVASTQKR